MRVSLAFLVLLFLSDLTARGYDSESGPKPPEHAAMSSAVHRQHGNIPDFGKHPTLRVSGNQLWSELEIAPQDVVLVEAGAHLIIDVEMARCETLATHGTVSFEPSKSVQLRFQQVLVHSNGQLQIEPDADQRVELIIGDKPLDPHVDPELWGNAVIILGEIKIRGTDKTAFTQFSNSGAPGDRTIELDEVAGWEVGDELHFPRLKMLARPRFEEGTIAAIDGHLITLDQPLTFAYPKFTDAEGETQHGYVANVSRNVVFRSENPQGNRGHFVAVGSATVDIEFARFEGLGRTRIGDLDETIWRSANGAAGSYVLSFAEPLPRTEPAFLGDDAWKPGFELIIDGKRRVIEALDYDCGIVTLVEPLAKDFDGDVLHVGTNQVGRYALHMHHVWGPPGGLESDVSVPDELPQVQGRLVGNVVTNSAKWGLVVHQTHFMHVRANVVAGATGAGIVAEDGVEIGNVFEANLSYGSPGLQGRKGRQNRTGNEGRGTGFMMAGPGSIMRDNVAIGNNEGIGIYAIGTKLVYGNNERKKEHFTARVPLRPGARHVDAETKSIRIREIAMPEFSGNVMIANAEMGLGMWGDNVLPNTPTIQSNVFIHNDVGAKYDYGNAGMVGNVGVGSGNSTFLFVHYWQSGSRGSRSLFCGNVLKDYAMGVWWDARGVADGVTIADNVAKNVKMLAGVGQSVQGFLQSDVLLKNNSVDGLEIDGHTLAESGYRIDRPVQLGASTACTWRIISEKDGERRRWWWPEQYPEHVFNGYQDPAASRASVFSPHVAIQLSNGLARSMSVRQRIGFGHPDGSPITAAENWQVYRTAIHGELAPATAAINPQTGMYVEELSSDAKPELPELAGIGPVFIPQDGDFRTIDNGEPMAIVATARAIDLGATHVVYRIDEEPWTEVPLPHLVPEQGQQQLVITAPVGKHDVWMAYTRGDGVPWHTWSYRTLEFR